MLASRPGSDHRVGSGRPSVVALGGGHGLYASLSALRLLDVDVTAVVTVADDGGSSGRIRRELGVLPPGDLRMALAALATKYLSPDAGGAPMQWSSVLQHRMGGTGALAGHPIGNLLLTGLMELYDDSVLALDELAGLVGASGRVLPMSEQPLDLIAEVSSVDPDDPVRRRRIRGQSAIAATAGRVTSIRLVPPDAPACEEAVRAIMDADVVLLGPGSWFTSVIPHLLVPGLAEALARTSARRVTILNLEQQAGETDGFTPEEHLKALREHCPRLTVDVVIADSDAVLDPSGLRSYIDKAGSRLLLVPVATTGDPARHDPSRLSAAIAEAAELNSHSKSDNGKNGDGEAGQPRGTEQGVH